MQAQEVLVLVMNPAGTERLDVRSEIQSILRAHGTDNVKIMYDPTRIEIAEEIGREDYDIFHLAGHCSAEGFLIKDGLLSPKVIAGYALSMRPKLRLVMLNACSSTEVAKEIGAEANVDVVFAEKDVEDQECIEFAILFHGKLRLNTVADYYDAYRLVDPSGKTFKFRFGASVMRSDNDIERLEEQMHQLLKAVDEIKEFLIGSFQKPGLNTVVANIVRTSEDHESRLKRLEASELESRMKRLETEAYRIVPTVIAAPAPLPAPEKLSDRDFYLRLVYIAILVALFAIGAYIVSTWGGVR